MVVVVVVVVVVLVYLKSLKKNSEVVVLEVVVVVVAAVVGRSCSSRATILSISRRACSTATIKLPKQMDPNDAVTDRKSDPRTGASR